MRSPLSIDVIFQTLKGKRLGHVYDEENMLTKLWPIANDRFPLLQYIDPYGDALFNGAQMNQIIVELRLLIDGDSSDAQKRLLRDVIGLATECQGSPHTFLRFLGD